MSKIVGSELHVLMLDSRDPSKREFPTQRSKCTYRTNSVDVVPNSRVINAMEILTKTPFTVKGPIVDKLGTKIFSFFGLNLRKVKPQRYTI